MPRPFRVSEYVPLRLAAVQVPPVMVCANMGAAKMQAKENRTALREVVILETFLARALAIGWRRCGLAINRVRSAADE